MQNDFLFQGSVIDNITFFDRFPDIDWAVGCAQVACIHDELSTFPMAYDTHIGEIGSSLSQGQTQRVLIARALYQRRPFLLLDEGTAHLNGDLETKIMGNLRSIGCSMIFTSHKQELENFATQSWTISASGGLDIQYLGASKSLVNRVVKT